MKCVKRDKKWKKWKQMPRTSDLTLPEKSSSLSVNSAAFKIMAEGERLPRTTLPQLRLTAYIIIMQYRKMLIRGTVILWIKRILYREPRINLLLLLVS